MGRRRIVRGWQFHSDSWGRSFAGNYTNEIDKTVGLLQCSAHYIAEFNDTVGLEQCGAHYITEFDITIGLKHWGQIWRWCEFYIIGYASTIGLAAMWQKISEGKSMLRGRNHCRWWRA
jgi:hypothetical protein